MDTIKVYKAQDGWRWKRQAENNREVAESGEAYTRKDDAITAADREAGNLDEEVRVEVLE